MFPVALASHVAREERVRSVFPGGSCSGAACGNMRRAAVCALLLLGFGLGHGHGHGLDAVPAPQNVTVQCSDHKPRVHWNYISHNATTFTVRLKSSSAASVRTRDLDLSRWVWAADHMLEFLYVDVTATRGDAHSSPARSPSFSYKFDKAVDVVCALQFPPVRFTRGLDAADATLKFENPLDCYDLRDKGLSFSYDVVLRNRSTVASLCLDQVCSLALDVPEGSCVNLTGFVTRQYVKLIQVLHPEPVCAAAPSDVGRMWLLVSLLLVLFLLTVAGLTAAICKTRAWIFPTIPTPKTLLVPETRQNLSVPPAETIYSAVIITDPGSAPQSEEDQALILQDQALILQDQALILQDQALILQDQTLILQDQSHESTETETISIHSSDSVELSTYERRPVLIDFDESGDVVTGYFS